MNIRIQPNKYIHYLLIYFMIIVNQSNLYKNFLENYGILIVAIFSMLILFKKKYQNSYTIIFLIFMLFSCTWVRVYAGGIGLRSWIAWSVRILVTLYAIQFSRKHFLTRYVNIVIFLGAISIVGFFLGRLNPQLLQELLPTHYATTGVWRQWFSETSYTTYPYYADGLFLFTLNENHVTRNCGIFSEPGIYQMVINSALFIILFFREQIQVDDNKITRYISILIFALITTQSTTGYIGLGVIILFYFISKQRDSSNLKLKFFILIIVGMIGLYADYSIRDNGSLLYTSVLSKVFSNSGTLDITASTGSARMGTILICLSTMLQHPLGIGYDRLHILLNTEETGFLAAQIMQTGAVLGIIPLTAILYWIFAPIIKSSMNVKVKILFILLYFNTALAQSSEFYPALIMIPLFFNLQRKKIEAYENRLVEDESNMIKINVLRGAE